MLDVLVKSAVRRKILGLFALNQGRRFYPRYIAKQIQESAHAVGLELVYLVKSDILNVTQEGTHAYYQWNQTYSFAALLVQTIKKMRDMGQKEILSLPCLDQEERLKENLIKVVADIKKYYQPEKIILFGSAAGGTIGPNSDLDIVIIKKTSLAFFKRAQQLVDMLDYDVDIDFLVYTPEEFEQALKQKNFFRVEILKKGKVLYDRAA